MTRMSDERLAEIDRHHDYGHCRVNTESCQLLAAIKAERQCLAEAERQYQQKVAELITEMNRAEAAEARVAELEVKLEAVRDVTHSIAQTCAAYPDDVFIEPTKEQWKQIAEILKAAGFSLDAVSGSCMRHVAKRVATYADELEALLEKLK